MDEAIASDRKRNGNGRSPARGLKKSEIRSAETVPPARLFTFEQAQSYLGGMSEWKLRTIAYARLLPVVVFTVGNESGCKWYFDKQDLDALIAQNKKLL
jgi:hypothetical protein